MQRNIRMLFKCVFTRRKSHQSRIFDSFQFYPQFVHIDMASFRLSLRIIQPCRRYIPVHELCKSLSSVVCEILPADHALTGCDTTSSFFGIGKNSKNVRIWGFHNDATLNVILLIQFVRIQCMQNYAGIRLFLCACQTTAI
jgi:hypothetical protein